MENPVQVITGDTWTVGANARFWKRITKPLWLSVWIIT